MRSKKFAIIDILQCYLFKLFRNKFVFSNYVLLPFYVNDIVHYNYKCRH